MRNNILLSLAITFGFLYAFCLALSGTFDFFVWDKALRVGFVIFFLVFGALSAGVVYIIHSQPQEAQQAQASQVPGIKKVVKVVSKPRKKLKK